MSDKFVLFVLFIVFVVVLGILWRRLHKRPALDDCQTWGDFIRFFGGLPKDEARCVHIQEDWDNHLCPEARQHWTAEERHFWQETIVHWRERWLQPKDRVPVNRIFFHT